MKDELAENYHKLAIYKLEGRTSNKVYALKKMYHQRNILRRIEQGFPVQGPESVLEIGPGMGCLAELLFSLYPKMDYTVLDNNQGTIDGMRSRFPDIHAHRVEELEQLPSVAEQYDVIAAIDVWEHLPSEDLVGYTRWCHGALRPGGMMILQFPNWGCPMTASTFYSDLTHINRFNERTVQQLFELVGIPPETYQLYNRRTPGLLGAVRDVLMEGYGLYIKMLHILFGTVRLKLFSPDLVVVVRKPDHVQVSPSDGPQ